MIISCKNSVEKGYSYNFDLSGSLNSDKKTGDSLQSIFNLSGNNFLGDLLVSQKLNEIVLTDGAETIEWEKANFLVCELWHNNPFVLTINGLFFEKGGENIFSAMSSGNEIMKYVPDSLRMICSVGVLPNLKTQIIIPLNSLSGQNIFLPRQPRQLIGRAFGVGINKTNIGKLSLAFLPGQEIDMSNIKISSVYISEKMPAPFKNVEQPVVDEFGQWTERDWTGKIKNEKKLKESVMSTEVDAESASFSEEWSRFGGWKKKKFESSGYFTTRFDGERWWLVDPDGYAFLSAGIDCINISISGEVNGQEDLFKWLPLKDDTIFQSCYSHNSEQFNFLQANLIRVYDNEWEQKWKKISFGLMKKWHFNTIGNWSEGSFIKYANMPYVFTLSGFPTTKEKVFRDFPDVYSLEYCENASMFATQLETHKNDSLLIGYFLQNEPQWAFGANNLAMELLNTKNQLQTKKEFIIWLERKYICVSDFNQAWNLKLGNFHELESTILTFPPSAVAWNDTWEFSGIMVEKYIEVVCREVKKVDPKHLNLGMRYNHISSDLLYKGGNLFDVFSINGYSNPGPPSTSEITRITGRPVIIGEWHFGCSMEGGLPASGLQAAKSQKDRADAYRFYVEQGFARPEIIGIHWFQLFDQPVNGRFDGENYNIGFLDICMKPYPDLTNSARLSNSNIYPIASGIVKPYNRVIEKVTPVY